MITILTYKELYNYISAFSQKKLNLLIVVSRGGLGKTFIAEEALMEEAPLVFTGHVTPLSLYMELYKRNKEEKDFIVMFDDVDALMMNKTNVAILKQLCDTREEKTIKYFTSSPILKDVPKDFETSCKVLMNMNDIKTEDKNLNALLTRAHLVNFDPSSEEILKHMKEFAKDEEILDFIKKYAPFSKQLNLRVYKRADEIKQSKLDWKQEILSELDIDMRLFEIEMLLRKYKTDIERERHFSESRSSYYRMKRMFLSKNPEYEKIKK